MTCCSGSDGLGVSRCPFGCRCSPPSAACPHAATSCGVQCAVSRSYLITCAKPLFVLGGCQAVLHPALVLVDVHIDASRITRLNIREGERLGAAAVHHRVEQHAHARELLFELLHLALPALQAAVDGLVLHRPFNLCKCSAKSWALPLWRRTIGFPAAGAARRAGIVPLSLALRGFGRRVAMSWSCSAVACAAASTVAACSSPPS